MITLNGRPVPKKNNGRIVTKGKFPFLLPSKAFCEFEKKCLQQLKSYNEYYEGSIWVKCKYWLPNKQWYPDLVNLLSATHDILEKAKIIDNDRNIVCIDGSQIIGLDKENPRTEIEIVSLMDNPAYYNPKNG